MLKTQLKSNPERTVPETRLRRIIFVRFRVPPVRFRGNYFFAGRTWTRQVLTPRTSRFSRRIHNDTIRFSRRTLLTRLVDDSCHTLCANVHARVTVVALLNKPAARGRSPLTVPMANGRGTVLFASFSSSCRALVDCGNRKTGSEEDTNVWKKADLYSETARVRVVRRVTTALPEDSSGSSPLNVRLGQAGKFPSTQLSTFRIPVSFRTT